MGGGILQGGHLRIEMHTKKSASSALPTAINAKENHI